MTSEDNGAHALIRGRHSIRAFRDTQVDRDVLQRILATAASSPSGTNMQPWQVYVLTGEARDVLVERVKAVREREPERERPPEAVRRVHLQSRTA